MSNIDIFELYNTLHKRVNDLKSKHTEFDYKPNVGVFGENSTGKSTFLNALLGNKYEFKMGMSETTDKIYVLHNGGINKTNYNFEYRQKDYEYLKYMNIYDVPGFGKYFPEDYLYKFLNSLDIVFWIVDSSKSIKKSDINLLKRIKKSNSKVIIVFNKIDSVINEVEYNIDRIKKNIDNTYNIFKKEGIYKNIIGIIPFSAIKQLVSNTKNNDNLLYCAYDKILSNILLYSVFIESYEKNYKYINISHYFKNWYYNKIHYILLNFKKSLVFKLKKKIGFINRSKLFMSFLRFSINKTKFILIKLYDKINLVWDIFWTNLMDIKSLKILKIIISKIVNIAVHFIQNIYNYIYYIYAKTLYYRLHFIIKNMSQILLDYMLKDINNTLAENEIKELQNIVNEN